MKKIEFEVKNINGLESRKAAQLVSEANKYTSEIKLYCNDNFCDLKSIMDVFGTIYAEKGDKLMITFEGIDELKAEEGFKKILSIYEF